MSLSQVPLDDVEDVMEMAKKIEKEIIKILDGNDIHLAMSALISAFINCVAKGSVSLDEFVRYRNFTMKFLDQTVRTIKHNIK